MSGSPLAAVFADVHGNYLALQACLDLLKTRPWGPAESVWLSYEPENQAARALYHKFGFEENGQMCGEEIVAARKL